MRGTIPLYFFFGRQHNIGNPKETFCGKGVFPLPAPLWGFLRPKIFTEDTAEQK